MGLEMFSQFYKVIGLLIYLISMVAGFDWSNDKVMIFHQTDYILTVERFSVEFYNKTYFKNAKVAVFHYTRTERRANISGNLAQDLTSDIVNYVQAYKFASNEYRLFPVVYNGNACALMQFNTFGMSPSNFDTNVKSCPVKKGFYYCYNIKFDESKFPPYAPRGRYMLDIKTYHNKTDLLCHGKIYVEIKPTNPLEKVI